MSKRDKSGMSGGYEVHPSLTGGVLWTGDLTGHDSGYSAVKSFIAGHEHEGWTLSIFDGLTKGTIEVECELSEMPQIVAFVYNTEHAAPMLFIGENPLRESYVVGMTCTRGRLSIPGLYRVEGGKLVELNEG